MQYPVYQNLGKRVLVIEPDAAVAKGLEVILSKQGFDVQTARDGASALQAFSPGRFDTVTTSYRLGAMNGLDLARAIKAQCPTQPIVLISSQGLTAAAREEESLFVGEIQKPFAIEDLLAIITVACLLGSGHPEAA